MHGCSCIARETWIPLEVPDILHSQTAVDLFFFVQQSFESCLTLSPLVHWFLKPFLGFLTRVSNRYCQAVKKHRESPFAFRLSQRATVNFQSLDLRLKLVCDKVELPPDPIPPPEKSLLSVSNLTRAGHRRVPSAQEFGTHQAPASTSVTPRGEGDDTQGRGGGTRRRWLGGLNLFGRSGTRTPRQDPTEEQGVSPGGGGWPGDSGGERDSPPGRTRRRSLGRTGGGGEMPLSDSEVVHERGERGLSPDGSGGQRRGRFFQELVGAVTGGHDRDGGAEWEGAARNRGPGRGKKKKKKRWKNPFGGGGGGGKGSDREETERPNNRWGMRNFFGRGGGGDRRSGGEEAEVTENEANGGDGGSSGDDSDSSIPSEFEREGLGKIFLVKGRKCNAGYETARLINLGPQAVNADGTLVHDPEVKGAKGKKAKGKGVRYEKSEAETAMLTETVPQLLVRLHNLAFMVDELDDLAEKLMRNARTELTALLQDPWLDEAKDRLGLEKEKAAREFAALRRQDSGTATDEGGVSRTPSGLLLRRSVMPMGTGVFAGVAVTSDVPRFSAGGPQTPTSNRGSVSSMGKRRTSKLGQRQSIRFAPDVVDGGRPSLGGISENKEMTDMDNMPTPKHGGGGDGGGKSESVIEEELAEMSEILNTALDQCDITAERAGEELCKYLAARVVYHEFQEELFVNLYKPQRRKASGSTGPSGSALESQDEGDSASERGGALGAGRGRGGSMEEGGGLTTLTDVLRVMEERAAPFLSHAPPAMSSHLWRALVFEIAHAWLWVITQMGRAGLNFIDDSRDPDPDHEIAVTTLQKDLTALVQFARGRADVGADFEVSVAGVPKKTQTHVVNARSKFGSSHTDSISSGTSSEDAIATTGAGKKEEKDEGPPPTVCFPLPPPFEPTKVNLFKYLGGIFFLLRDHPNCLKSEASETRKFLGG
uniref:Uncharacterized protein n=1 Tax=Chromera velia CCMP2878 TaxID=1169474 RepID=A0A0G4HQK6_9ALVE|eukprot:Cvel_30214.t1-p1 / transcript=Cvel_30214.t1 / gene=Cvel_30214 / organism=Chromera_velia_CCMP2878 / gene_product=hypothetical protein / transcript_product=hypothetical protein / location=Cvel_scaffold4275:253-5527(+) / protein_length=935 / sequence_SO=supercontig / SO=protein_coding / is_pseudo=false